MKNFSIFVYLKSCPYHERDVLNNTSCMHQSQGLVYKKKKKKHR